MNVTLNNISDLKKHLQKRLGSLYPPAEINSIAGIIISTLIEPDKLQVLKNPLLEIPPRQRPRLLDICSKLEEGMPVQYALGETIFYNCRIRLNRHTLIPRQETEELVDLIIKENQGYCGRILDIGTGPGTIAIALAANLPHADITALDISHEALTKAEENAILNNVRFKLLKYDILNPESGFPGGRFGIVVSNPPYVPESEKKGMHINITGYEPSRALFVPDRDPLLFYRAIALKRDYLLSPGGKLYFEMHEKAGKALYLLLQSNGFSDIRIISDITGRERFITAIFNG